MFPRTHRRRSSAAAARRREPVATTARRRSSKDSQKDSTELGWLVLARHVPADEEERTAVPRPWGPMNGASTAKQRDDLVRAETSAGQGHIREGRRHSTRIVSPRAVAFG